MSTPFGRVVINTRERAVSTDINRLQDLLGQDLGEVFRGLSGVHTYPAASPAEDRSAVLRGLTGTPGAGMSVDIAEGHALVMAAGAVGADDSRYRLLRARTTQNAVLGASDPANPRYDLVEVSAAADTTESPLRDIYDPVTGTFAPAVVPKVVRAGVTVQVTAGVAAANPTLPAFSGGNWIPIMAVRVPAAAAGIVQNDISDLRPLWVPAPTNRMHGVKQGLSLFPSSAVVDVASFILRPGVAVVDGQVVRRTNSQSLTLASHVDSGVVLAANTWYYVYLFAGRSAGATGFRPRHTVPGSPTLEGFVVVTNVVPTSDGYPSAAVNLPTGYAANHFYGGTSTRGLYLGAIRTGTAATDVSPFQRHGDWIRRNEVFANFVAGASPSTTTVLLNAAGLLPATCNLVEINVQCQFVNDPATALHLLRVRTEAGTTFNATLLQFRPVAADVDQISGGRCVVPVTIGAPAFDVRLETLGVDRWVGGLQQFGVCGIYDPVPRTE